VWNNLKNIDKDAIIGIAVLRNEKPRLPFFLSYYRKLGISHFFIIDNQSTDGTDAYLRQFADCTVWLAAGSYKKAWYGLHWVNYLLGKYCCNHWILHVDPDEFLVYPYMDTRNIKSLTRYLEDASKYSFNTILIDCYGDKPIDAMRYKEGDDIVKFCPYFDKYGYTSFHNTKFGETCAGGVRARQFIKNKDDFAPSLQKTPLVKWRKSYRFITSTHDLYPRYLNRVCSPKKDCFASGCLLHFKFIADFKEKVEEELQRRQHWNNSREYKRYAEILDKPNTMFINEASIKYQDWKTLIETRLMGAGNWL
jgi:hypothetical protein